MVYEKSRRAEIDKIIRHTRSQVRHRGKKIVNSVLHEFVLYEDRIELRYRVPVTELRVSELLKVFSYLKKSSICVTIKGC